ncbi:MAG: hypothetical protein AB2A00_26785 [Myxococcota bacterium]
MKGDLAAHMMAVLGGHKLRGKKTERVIVIRPFSGTHVVELQLLKGDASIDPLTHAQALAEVFEGATDGLGIRQAAATRILFALAIEQNLTLQELRVLLLDRNALRARGERSTIPDVRLFIRHRLDREAAATLDGLAARADILLSVRAIRAALHGPGLVDFRRMFLPGAITILDFSGAPLGADGARRLLASLLLTRVIWAGFDAPGGRKTSTVILADELQEALTPYTERLISRVLTTGRSFGLGLWSCHQSVTQLPSSLASLLAANARIRLLFRTGADDAKAGAEYVPITGRVARAADGRGGPFLSHAEELRLRIAELGKLPTRSFLIADRTAPFSPRIIIAPEFSPPVWDNLPMAVRDEVERGAIGIPRNEALARLEAAEAELGTDPAPAVASEPIAGRPSRRQRTAVLPGASAAPIPKGRRGGMP